MTQSRIQGFTLVEILVTMAIIVILDALLISNFSRFHIDLNQTTLQVADAVRQAQSLALAGSVTNGSYRCGYGVHFTATSYTVFAGIIPNGTTGCASSTNIYGGGVDIQAVLLPDPSLAFSPVPPDIYFAPPIPTTYIGGSSAVGSTTITLESSSATSCPGADCHTITVYTSGRIDTQ